MPSIVKIVAAQNRLAIELIQICCCARLHLLIFKVLQDNLNDHICQQRSHLRPMKTITPSQFRAARGILGLSQKELGKIVDVSGATLMRFEGGASPKASLMKIIVADLEKAGIFFVDKVDGVHDGLAGLRHGFSLPAKPSSERGAKKDDGEGEVKLDELTRLGREVLRDHLEGGGLIEGRGDFLGEAAE